MRVELNVISASFLLTDGKKNIVLIFTIIRKILTVRRTGEYPLCAFKLFGTLVMKDKDFLELIDLKKKQVVWTWKNQFEATMKSLDDLGFNDFDRCGPYVENHFISNSDADGEIEFRRCM